MQCTKYVYLLFSHLYMFFFRVVPILMNIRMNIASIAIAIWQTWSPVNQLIVICKSFQRLSRPLQFLISIKLWTPFLQREIAKSHKIWTVCGRVQYWCFFLWNSITTCVGLLHIIVMQWDLFNIFVWTFYSISSVKLLLSGKSVT